MSIPKWLIRKSCFAAFLTFELASRIRDIGLTEYYRVKLKARNLRLKYPASIVNPHFITCNLFNAGPGLRIEVLSYRRGESFQPSLSIGPNFHAERNLHIGVISQISIGANVLIGSNVLITDHNHGDYRDPSTFSIPPIDRKLGPGRPIVIEDNVWICDGVVILPGTHIGEGSVIGANSVVSGVIPSHSIIKSIPRASIPSQQCHERTLAPGLI